MYYIHFRINGQVVRVFRDPDCTLHNKTVGDIFKCGESHTSGKVEQYKILSKKIVAEVFGGAPLYQVECEDASYYDKSLIKKIDPVKSSYDALANIYANIVR